MTGYTQDLEAGIATLRDELESVKNDLRLSEGAYAIANANIDSLKADVKRLADKAASLRMLCLKHGITVTD